MVGGGAVGVLTGLGITFGALLGMAARALKVKRTRWLRKLMRCCCKPNVASAAARLSPLR